MTMYKVIKSIFRMIPKKGIKSMLLLIIGFIVHRSLSTYFFNETFFEINKLARTTLIMIGLVVAYFLVAFLFQAIRYARALEASQPEEIKNIISPKSNKRKLSNRLELQSFSNNLVELVVYVERRWLPDDAIPSVEEFIDALRYTDPLCSKCHCNFKVNYRSIKSYQCPTPSCSNKQSIYDNDMFNMIEIAKAQFSGKIRSNYPKYWEMYISTYLMLTDGKPENYEEPW